MARIALVHDVAGVAELQAQLLREAGHDVDHVRLPDFGANWPVWAKAITLPARVLLYLPAIWRLRRTPYDVIHIHWVPRGIVGILSGKPFLIQAHGSDLHVHLRTPGMRRLCAAVLERARTILYVTPNLEPFISPFAGKSVHLPNPVRVRPADAWSPVPEHVRRIVVFTRLDPVKGVGKVFPATERLTAMGFDVTALRWGPLAAEYVPRYEGAAHFVEPVPHARVGEFLGGFDLVVGQMELGVLGLSELEAMSAGRPLIVGIDRSKYLGDGPPVVYSGDAEQLIEQIESLRDDSRRLENLSREGRAWVRRNHGVEAHLRLLESAYFGTPVRVSEMPMAM